jgi:UPF0716 protein FxsA
MISSRIDADRGFHARDDAVLMNLLLLFIVLPLAELALLLWLARLTSIGFTLALVIVTGAAGALLARSQGWRTLRRIRSELAAGRLPTESLVDALLIFVAGVLLLTPGVLTDAFGLLLLIPPCRRHYRRRLIHWLQSRFRLEPWRERERPSSNGASQIIDSYVVEDGRGGPADRR